MAKSRNKRVSPPATTKQPTRTSGKGGRRSSAPTPPPPPQRNPHEGYELVIEMDGSGRRRKVWRAVAPGQKPKS